MPFEFLGYGLEPLHILNEIFSCEKYEIILTDYEIFGVTPNVK